MKMINPDLENRDFEFDNQLPNPDIDERLMQGLAYLIGYDLTNQIFRFLNIDSEGRLYVSSGATKANSVTNGAVSVGAVSTVIANTNPDRKYIEIINNSANDLYLGFTVAVTTVNGFLVPSGAVWYSEIYLGAIYMIGAVVGNDVRYIEMS